MIEIKNVTKRFGDKILFENVNLTISDGEFVIISGDSGCGKTTLLNMIGGIESVDAGEILIDGIDVRNKKNLLNLYRYKFGFLFQNFALIDNKTVEENLQIFKKDCLNGVSPKQALEYVGLADKYKEKIYQLSGGEQQRVALARLLIKKCDVLLADEPTGSLDRKNTERVLEIIGKLHDAGKTVVLVTHDDSIKRYCQRVIYLGGRNGIYEENNAND